MKSGEYLLQTVQREEEQGDLSYGERYCRREIAMFQMSLHICWSGLTFVFVWCIFNKNFGRKRYERACRFKFFGAKGFEG